MPASAPAAIHAARGSRSPITVPWVPADITEPLAAAESVEPTDATEPTEKAEAALPIEPIERNEPTEPIERADPFDATERTESSDHNDSAESPIRPPASRGSAAARRRRRRGPWSPSSPRRRSAPIAFWFPALNSSAASGSASIAASTAPSSSSPPPICPRPSRSTISAGSPPLARHLREHLLGAAVGDLLRRHHRRPASPATRARPWTRPGLPPPHPGAALRRARRSPSWRPSAGRLRRLPQAPARSTAPVSGSPASSAATSALNPSFSR